MVLACWATVTEKALLWFSFPFSRRFLQGLMAHFNSHWLILRIVIWCKPCSTKHPNHYAFSSPLLRSCCSSNAIIMNPFVSPILPMSIQGTMGWVEIYMYCSLFPKGELIERMCLLHLKCPSIESHIVSLDCTSAHIPLAQWPTKTWVHHQLSMKSIQCLENWVWFHVAVFR